MASSSETPLAESSVLLAAQSLVEANLPERAAELFAEFAKQFPDSALRAEVELAAARVVQSILGMGAESPAAPKA